MNINNKKPTLKDYGLTEQMVQDNKNANANRDRVRKANLELEENSKKVGWTIFGVITVIALLLASSVPGVAFFLILIGAGAGYGTNVAIKKSQKPLPPPYNPEIERKYQNYLIALKTYEANEKIKITTPVKSSQQHKAAKVKNEVVSTTNIKTISTKKTIEQKPVVKEQEYQVGMIVKHKKFGLGQIKQVNKNSHLLTIRFDDDYSFKMIDYTVAPMEIIETPTPKKAIKTEKPTVLSEETKPKPIVEEPIVKTFPDTKIGLTQAQSNLFDEMYNISLKYCVELEISIWKGLVGVGLIGKEHLRYWLTSSSKGNVYVKFGYYSTTLPFTIENRSQILSLTRQVNANFEEFPEKFALIKEKPITETKETPVIDKKDKLDIEQPTEIVKNIPQDDIFDYEEEDTVITEKTDENTSNEIDYDKSLFDINGTILLKVKDTPRENSYSIPQGVTEITDNALLDCKYVHDLVLPSSITTIGSNAFKNCPNLETIFCETKQVKKLLTNIPKNIEIVCLEF